MTKTTSLNIPEGGTAELKIRLSEAPDGPVTVDVVRTAGDTSLCPGTVVRFGASSLSPGFESTAFDVILFDQDAPRTVANFLNWLADGAYGDDAGNGGIAHELQPGTYLSGGVYKNDGGTPAPLTTKGATPVVEGDRTSLRGTLGMWTNNADTERAGKEWFFNLADNAGTLDLLDTPPTIFGQVVGDGMTQVVDPIGELATYALVDSPLNQVPLVETDTGYSFVLLFPVEVFATRAVTFDAGNWNDWQPVYVSAFGDPNVQTEQATLTCSAEDYDPVEVAVTNDDTDTVAILANPAEIVVVENQQASFEVRLSHIPTAPLDVSVARTDGDTDLSVQSGAALHFTPDTWDTPQQVTLAAAADEDGDNGTATFTLESPDADSAAVTSRESDLAFAIDPVAEQTSITVDEKEYAAFRIRLAEAPPSEMTVRIRRTGGDEDVHLPPVIRFSSILGTFDAALYDADTPATVANFLNYVHDGDFNSTFFHRSVPGFIIQAGSYAWGPSGVMNIATDPAVVNEPVRSNLRGTLAMAKLGGQPDSATSGWFINLANNSANLDFQNGGFTAFGEVLGDGMAVADAIADLPVVDLDAPFTDLPAYNWQQGDTVTGNNLVILPSVQEVNAAELRFTPENWDSYQTAWLTTRRDADKDSGQATLRVEWAGGQRAINPLDLQATEGERHWITFQSDGNGTTLPTVLRGFDVGRTTPMDVSATPNAGYAFSHWTLAPTGTVQLPQAPQTGIVPAADSTLTAHFATDDDDDNIPDAWEDENGLDSTTDDDAYDDGDGDGWVNRSEYRRDLDPHRHVVRLVAGWNAVSTGTREGTDVLQTLLADPAVQGPAWTRTPHGLARATTVAAGTAYWIRASTPTEIALQPPARSLRVAEPYDLPLSKGWNFIGVPREPLNPGVNALFDGDASVRTPVWTWRDGRFRIAGKLHPGEGYWVFATAETVISIRTRP